LYVDAALKYEEQRVAHPVVTVARSAWRPRGLVDGERAILEETAVAFTYNGAAYAVTMATPQDLEDLALGFSLTEGIVSSPADIRHLEIVEANIGIELRMGLSASPAFASEHRRPYLMGPTGCGHGRIEYLEEATPPPSRVHARPIFTPAEIMRALEALGRGQTLGRQASAVHTAAFWQLDAGLAATREDIGRHNALDKLAGALSRDGIPGQSGMVLLTSDVSAQAVRKAAGINVPLLVAISAPTALAVRTAERAGITLVGFARGDGFEIFTHPRRITRETVARHAVYMANSS
jgi:FdhD protein